MDDARLANLAVGTDTNRAYRPLRLNPARARPIFL